MTTSSQFEGSISQQPARVVNSHRDRAYSGNGEKIGESGTWGLSASRGADCSAGKASGFSPVELSRYAFESLRTDEEFRRIPPFRLGKDDIPDQLLIPEKLYGRDVECKVLLDAFDRVVASGIPRTRTSTSSVESLNNREGFGLANMRLRAKNLGAELDIQSAPDRGTSVVVRLPLAS